MCTYVFSSMLIPIPASETGGAAILELWRTLLHSYWLLSMKLKDTKAPSLLLLAEDMAVPCGCEMFLAVWEGPLCSSLAPTQPQQDLTYMEPQKLT